MTAYLCHKEIGQNSVPTQQLSAKRNHLAGHPGVPSLKRDTASKPLSYQSERRCKERAYQPAEVHTQTDLP